MRVKADSTTLNTGQFPPLILFFFKKNDELFILYLYLQIKSVHPSSTVENSSDKNPRGSLRPLS